MATISASTFIHDTVIAIRDILNTNMTDPLTRAGNEKFVMTSYPERNDTRYPVVTVRVGNVTTIIPAGMRSESMFFQVPIEIRVWARNARERDELTDQVINQLRTRQITGGTAATVGSNLFDFSVDSMVEVSEEGKQGIKSKIIRISYMYTAVS